MNPEIHYVLNGGQYKGEMRQAVITKRLSEELVNLAVFIDGENDRRVDYWQMSVREDPYGTPGTYHIGGPGCVCVQDLEGAPETIRVDRSNPFCPVFRFAETIIAAVPEYQQSPTMTLALKIAKDAESLLDCPPEARDKELADFEESVLARDGADGVAIVRGIIRQKLEEYWEAVDRQKASTPVLLQPLGEPFALPPLEPVVVELTEESTASQANPPGDLTVVEGGVADAATAEDVRKQAGGDEPEKEASQSEETK
jgi:hypothetical protein